MLQVFVVSSPLPLGRLTPSGNTPDRPAFARAALAGQTPKFPDCKVLGPDYIPRFADLRGKLRLPAVDPHRQVSPRLAAYLCKFNHLRCDRKQPVYKSKVITNKEKRLDRPGRAACGEVLIRGTGGSPSRAGCRACASHEYASLVDLQMARQERPGKREEPGRMRGSARRAAADAQIPRPHRPCGPGARPRHARGPTDSASGNGTYGRIAA
jgi:hypothetical protein